MTDNHVITFYSIEQIEDHEKLARVVERFCVKNKIVGTFFSTPQGVNTTLSGPKQSLINLISLLEDKTKLKLKDQTWSISSSVPFKRLKIKCRDRLLPLEGKFDPVLSRGTHVDPSEWNKLILDPETVVLDVRNDYETKIGSFKNSTIPNMKNFTDFPAFVESNLSSLKEKKIAMFCTGGIRCEIASSFMLQEGFVTMRPFHIIFSRPRGFTVSGFPSFSFSTFAQSLQRMKVVANAHGVVPSSLWPSWYKKNNN